MTFYENSIGESDEWYTPKDIFVALNTTFDLDPCSPGLNHWVPATRIYTKDDDGLKQSWGDSFVFMNPPFGGRLGHLPWLNKFLAHSNGIAVVRAYTSAHWFQDFAPLMGCFLFPRGKTKFVRADGTVGRSPGHGIVLFGLGKRAFETLQKCNLGIFVPNS